MYFSRFLSLSYTISPGGAPHPPTAPATINVDDRDPEIDLDVVHREHRTLPDGDIAALNNSFGFGGHNVALVVKSA